MLAVCLRPSTRRPVISTVFVQSSFVAAAGLSQGGPAWGHTQDGGCQRLVSASARERAGARPAPGSRLPRRPSATRVALLCSRDPHPILLAPRGLGPGGMLEDFN